MLKILKKFFIYTSLIILILIIIGSIINVLMLAAAVPFTVTHDNIDALPDDFVPDCIIVLGAKVINDDIMSTILSDRVKTGLDVYKHYETVPLLLSGGGEPGQDEVSAMSTFVTNDGVSKEYILEDRGGLNTYASISRAKEIFNAKKVIIVSQEFHIPRSIFISRSLGLEAYGVSSDLRKYFFKNYVREYFARIKEAVMILF